MDNETQSATAAARPATKPRWIVRPMRVADIDKCLRIWSMVELAEGRQTVASSLAADPDGLYVAELVGGGYDGDHEGQVIGMCAGVVTRHDTAFMGFYGVEPKYQKIGVGRELWARTIGRLEGLNIGLYGVPNLAPKYKANGFVVEDSVRMLIYESDPISGKAGLNLDCLRLDEDTNASRAPADYELTTLRWTSGNGGCPNRGAELMFAKLVDYDAQVQCISREQLLKLYLCTEDAPRTVLAVRRRSSSGDANCEETPPQSICQATGAGGDVTADSSRPPNEYTSFDVVGYGCARDDNTGGIMIGPLYANSVECCKLLLANLLERSDLAEGHIFSIMVLSSNLQAAQILDKVGLRETEQCSRLFTRFVPEAKLDKVFFVHSPNFSLF